MAEKFVEVAEFGGEVKKYLLEDGENPDQLVQRAGLAGKGAIRIDGTPIDQWKRSHGSLAGGEIITVVPAVKGGLAA